MNWGLISQVYCYETVSAPVGISTWQCSSSLDSSNYRKETPSPISVELEDRQSHLGPSICTMILPLYQPLYKTLSKRPPPPLPPFYLFKRHTVFISNRKLHPEEGGIATSAVGVQANVVAPNKHLANSETMYKGHLLESETYIGGKVEALESGVFRSDLPTKFKVKPAAYQVRLPSPSPSPPPSPPLPSRLLLQA